MNLSPSNTKKSNNKWQKLRLSWPPGKKEWITSGILVILLASGTSYALLRQTAPEEPSQLVVARKEKLPTTVPSTLTGLPVEPSVNQQTVTGVMIENSLYARPQSGLGQAGVVFEAIAEGGITRFLALFQDTAPESVGPIRSARPYYVSWALGFDAGYAHVGGSPEALANIKAWKVRDLDQFANGGSYHRSSSREAPHNVYTSIAALNKLENSKGYNTSTYSGFERKKKETPLKTPTASTINMSISGPVYNADYTYDAATNNYKRSEGGEAHIEANTNSQISPKVVIAMVIPYSLASDGYHSSYSNIGSGVAYIFQDGGVSVGNWTKTDNTSQIKFTDAAGNVIPLNPGQTWLTAIAAANKVTYRP